MTSKTTKTLDQKALELYNLSEQILDILSTLTPQELQYLKLLFEVVFKHSDLHHLRKQLEGSLNQQNAKEDTNI